MNRQNRRRFNVFKTGNARFDSITQLNDAKVYVLMTWDGKADRMRLFFEASKDEKKDEIEVELLRLRDVGAMLLNDRVLKAEAQKTAKTASAKVTAVKEKRSRELAAAAEDYGEKGPTLAHIVAERLKKMKGK